MPKYDQVAEQLKHRIRQGDYALRGLPAERQLAGECGVAHMTARRAVQQLVEEGFLVRRPNGRIDVRRDDEGDGVGTQIAFLAPSFSSSSFDLLYRKVGHIVESAEMIVRHVVYRHWDDPVIVDALESFDGVFFLPTSEKMPDAFVRRLANAKKPLVTLEEDLSHLGIPSVRLSCPTTVQSVLDHLEAQGHRVIDCMNVQPHDSVIEFRLHAWQDWMKKRGFTGRLHDEPVQPFTDTWEQAYRMAYRVLGREDSRVDALLCLTLTSATGAARAMHDLGIRPGIDIAFAAVGGEGLAASYIPSITATELQDITPFITQALQWMANAGGTWEGPLLMQPTAPNLVVRESTSTPRSTPRSKNY